MTYLLLSVDGANSTQLALIHEAVKQSASSWWHQQSSVWIIESDEKAVFWRDRITLFTTGVGGSVLVLALPSEPRERKWATKALHTKWLVEKYAPNFTYGGKRVAVDKPAAVERGTGHD